MLGWIDDATREKLTLGTERDLWRDGTLFSLDTGRWLGWLPLRLELRDGTSTKLGCHGEGKSINLDNGKSISLPLASPISP